MKPSNLVALPGFVAFFVNIHSMKRFGLEYGSTFVARYTLETPKPGALVLAWLDGDRYLLRVVEITDDEVTLEDDDTRKTFSASEARFEAVGAIVAGRRRTHARAPVINMGGWLDTHPRPIRNLLFAEKQ